MPPSLFDSHPKGTTLWMPHEIIAFWTKTKGYVTKNLPGWTLTVVKEVAERAIKGEIKLDASPRNGADRPLTGQFQPSSVELFRYRGAAKDGGTLEYVFEAGEQNSANAVTKEKAAEIAADFMTTFYGVEVGALETQQFRTSPVPCWLVCFSDSVAGPLRQLF